MRLKRTAAKMKPSPPPVPLGTSAARAQWRRDGTEPKARWSRLLLCVMTSCFASLLLLAGCGTEPVFDITKKAPQPGQFTEPDVPLPDTMHEPGAEEPFKDLPRPEVSPEFPSTKELAKVEVKEYEGERLDSFRDIRDLSIKGPQDVDRASYRLVVTGMVDNRLELPYDDVLKYPSYSKVVTLYCVTGWDATILWEGVLLEDLIADAKPRPDVNTVIFTAADGYTTSLPLDYIRDNDILLAYKVNNVTLPPDKGFPFEVVAESKWGYKWIKWVTKIELSNDPTYEGYWESRGYPNDAEVGK